MRDIPDEKAWHSEEWGLDEPYAFKSFYGKSLNEAEKLFEGNALNRLEELNAMPKEVLCYYIAALLNYMLSDRAKGDADCVNGFLSLLENRGRDFQQLDKWTVQSLKQILYKIRENPEWFGRDESIDIDWMDRADHSLVVLRAMG